MRLGPSPKKYLFDGHRIVDPKTTLQRVEPLCKIAGITRIADITGLDRVGIPVYSSIRPSAESGAVSVYNGKGATKEQAKVSAIMEGLERYSAEQKDREVVRAKPDEMLSSRYAIHPSDLILPKTSLFHVDFQSIAWVEGVELNEMERIWVPANAVFHPYTSRLDMTLFRSNTNGLASGNSLEEAVLHGLCEVIERDAWSICEVKRCVKSDLSFDAENGLVYDLVQKFESQGIRIHMKELTSDIGIPTIGVAADDWQTKDPTLLVMGIGTHLNPHVAAIRALTEAAQSRVTQIHGAREDTINARFRQKLGYEKTKSINRMWFSNSGNEKKVSEIDRLDSMDIYDDILFVLDQLKKRGFRKVIAVDLTREELGVPVVRIIVPGLEVFAMDEERVGRRLMEATT
ncbi:MAG: YcaO-related McrA-glycine thioamidation protein [Methanomassiliicoccales archaeon]|jgi:ribosomal protein S12 methylthiotransferase accessory factor|nr:YcaO-related McrA-glycine thioamidation protein [Methanomassiliicoccales archaeon]